MRAAILLGFVWMCACGDSATGTTVPDPVDMYTPAKALGFSPNAGPYGAFVDVERVGSRTSSVQLDLEGYGAFPVERTFFRYPFPADGMISADGRVLGTFTPTWKPGKGAAGEAVRDVIGIDDGAMVLGERAVIVFHGDVAPIVLPIGFVATNGAIVPAKDGADVVSVSETRAVTVHVANDAATNTELPKPPANVLAVTYDARGPVLLAKDGSNVRRMRVANDVWAFDGPSLAIPEERLMHAYAMTPDGSVYVVHNDDGSNIFDQKQSLIVRRAGATDAAFADVWIAASGVNDWFYEIAIRSEGGTIAVHGCAHDDGWDKGPDTCVDAARTSTGFVPIAKNAHVASTAKGLVTAACETTAVIVTTDRGAEATLDPCVETHPIAQTDGTLRLVAGAKGQLYAVRKR